MGGKADGSEGSTVTKSAPSPVEGGVGVRYGAADAGPLPPSPRGTPAPTGRAQAAPGAASHRPDRRLRRPPRDVADHRVRAGSNSRDLPGSAGPGQPAAARRAAHASHGRSAQRAPHPVAGRAESSHRHRLPLVRRRRPPAEPTRPPGQRGRAVTARAQDLRRRRRRLRLLPTGRRRDRRARRGRRARHGCLRAGGRHRRRDLRRSAG
ncbi:MAG: hypothetical protein E6G09_13630 [Actinobacteria bacterium]|nr:MAG: hypothetical protein E6G09_13630 [Actinomycetota bacterium]